MERQRPQSESGNDAPPGRWWEGFFDDLYADVGLHSIEPERIEKTVGFLIDLLHLKPGQTVFDQCCGVGRLSIPLAQRGMRVIGVDQVESYIARAGHAAAAADDPAVAERCEFHCGDGYQFTAPSLCDAAFNWFTSFGYSDDDDVNARMIERAFASLKPGGRFALDYHSTPKVLRSFMQKQHETFETDRGVVSLLIDHRADFVRGMIEADWTFIHPDGRRETRRVATRMLLPHEIIGMMRRAGFGNFELFGSTDGEPFTLDSIRSIVVAEKP